MCEWTKLTGFTDSDWYGSVDDWKSTTGWVFNLDSAVISWCSKEQDIIALSSTEAKYILVISTACEAVWMRWVLKGMNQVQNGPTSMYCDNSLPIAIAKNPTLHERTKHIDTKFYFIYGLVSDGLI